MLCGFPLGYMLLSVILATAARILITIYSPPSLAVLTLKSIGEREAVRKNIVFVVQLLEE